MNRISRRLRAGRKPARQLPLRRRDVARFEGEQTCDRRRRKCVGRELVGDRAIAAARRLLERSVQRLLTLRCEEARLRRRTGSRESARQARSRCPFGPPRGRHVGQAGTRNRCRAPGAPIDLVGDPITLHADGVTDPRLREVHPHARRDVDRLPQSKSHGTPLAESNGVGGPNREEGSRRRRIRIVDVGAEDPPRHLAIRRPLDIAVPL